MDQLGISHISFTVDDVGALAEELVSKGVSLAGTLDDFTDDQGAIRIIFVYNPDGNLVRFDEGSGD